MAKNQINFSFTLSVLIFFMTDDWPILMKMKKFDSFILNRLFHVFPKKNNNDKKPPKNSEMQLLIIVVIRYCCL